MILWFRVLEFKPLCLLVVASIVINTFYSITKVQSYWWQQRLFSGYSNKEISKCKARLPIVKKRKKKPQICIPTNSFSTTTLFNRCNRDGIFDKRRFHLMSPNQFISSTKRWGNVLFENESVQILLNSRGVSLVYDAVFKTSPFL